MNLMGLLFKNCSNPSPMESKTPKGKTPQEGKMDATSEKVLMQKMLEYTEAQVEVLKKIISHLSKIEKEEAKKEKDNHEPNKLTQEDINHMMTKEKVCLLLPTFKPQLKSAPGPWTFKRSHVNDFSLLGDVGSWEDHDWPEWTSKVGTMQVTPARFMLERNMDPSSNGDQYLVMNKEEEGDD